MDIGRRKHRCPELHDAGGGVGVEGGCDAVLSNDSDFLVMDIPGYVNVRVERQAERKQERERDVGLRFFGVDGAVLCPPAASAFQVFISHVSIVRCFYTHHKLHPVFVPLPLSEPTHCTLLTSQAQHREFAYPDARVSLPISCLRP